MKKVLTSFMVMILMFGVGLNKVFAITEKQSYEAIQAYYKALQTLPMADDIITYESLGLDSSKLPLGEGVIVQDKASDVAKTIIALVLHGDNPRQYQGTDYVDILEKTVDSKGAVRFASESQSFGANNQVYCVYALYVVDSAQTELAADYLASMIASDGAFGFAGGYTDSAVTGWVIEALSLVNKDKYQTTIQQSLDYFKQIQNEEAGYDAFGGGSDPNSQAGVIEGLSVYDLPGLKADVYNKNEKNPYQVLLQFQNSDGSFWSPYTGVGVDNPLATLQAAQAIGTYHNGSVYKHAKQEFQALLTKQTEPQIKKKVVQTADQEKITLYLTVLLMSGCILWKRRESLG